MAEDDDDTQRTSLWNKLLGSIESVIDLRVVTYVGDVEISGPFNKPTIKLPSEDPKKAEARALATSINLAQGDITSAIPEEFIKPDHQIIRDYHQAQVAQANTIVERNVGLLIELVKSVASDLRGVEAREDSPPLAPAQDDSAATPASTPATTPSADQTTTPTPS